MKIETSPISIELVPNVVIRPLNAEKHGRDRNGAWFSEPCV